MGFLRPCQISGSSEKKQPGSGCVIILPGIDNNLQSFKELAAEYIVREKQVFICDYRLLIEGGFYDKATFSSLAQVISFEVEKKIGPPPHSTPITLVGYSFGAELLPWLAVKHSEFSLVAIDHPYVALNMQDHNAKTVEILKRILAADLAVNDDIFTKLLDALTAEQYKQELDSVREKLLSAAKAQKPMMVEVLQNKLDVCCKNLEVQSRSIESGVRPAQLNNKMLVAVTADTVDKYPALNIANNLGWSSVAGNVTINVLRSLIKKGPLDHFNVLNSQELLDALDPRTVATSFENDSAVGFVTPEMVSPVLGPAGDTVQNPPVSPLPAPLSDAAYKTPKYNGKMATRASACERPLPRDEGVLPPAKGYRGKRTCHGLGGESLFSRNVHGSVHGILGEGNGESSGSSIIPSPGGRHSDNL